MSRRAAILLVLLSTLGFGSIAMFAKIAYAAGVSPSLLLALRFLLAGAFLAPVVWLKRIPMPRGRVLAGFILMGALYTAQSQSYFTALMYASSGLVALLLYIYPILVTALALLLGWERLNRRTLTLLALATAGLAITLGGKLQGQPLGIGLGLLAAAVYAVYILLGNQLTRDTHPLAATLVVLGIAAIGNGAFAIAGGSRLPHSASAWLAIAAIALFSTVLAIAAFLTGIKRIGAAQASIISTLEPVITLILGVALLDESISVSQLIGGTLVLTAVILLAQRPALRVAAG
ncbi:MAG TPA: EamA family transporter [Oxalobacteraceae bacterium]|nr:EamA family transporter [Oxalobacteraceae bacterium]HCN88168.1 EamA family transporter [Oxalobacteraceae bacterium]